jgi:hypothetical protein
MGNSDRLSASTLPETGSRGARLSAMRTQNLTDMAIALALALCLTSDARAPSDD